MTPNELLCPTPCLKILALTPFHSPSHAWRENNELQLVNMILVLCSSPSGHLSFQLPCCLPIPLPSEGQDPFITTPPASFAFLRNGGVCPSCSLVPFPHVPRPPPLPPSRFFFLHTSSYTHLFYTTELSLPHLEK